MGSITEFFRYMQCDPLFLEDTKKTLAYIEPTETLKAKRREHKLYEEFRINVKEHKK